MHLIQKRDRIVNVLQYIERTRRLKGRIWKWNPPAIIDLAGFRLRPGHFDACFRHIDPMGA